MGYISLKDLYSGSVLGSAVPPLPRQTIKHTLIEQAPEPAVQPVAFDPNIVTDWTTWASVDVPSDLFEAGKTGTGRGEYSVASLLSGLKTKAKIDKAKLVSGGNVSYDVKVGDAEYEVKEVKGGELDVRIGAEGVDVANTIKAGLITCAKMIFQMYKTLTKSSQEELNTLLKKKFNNDKFNLGVYLRKFTDGMLYELPSALIANPGVVVNKQSKNWALEPSILTAIKAIEELQLDQSMSSAPGVKNSRINALLDLVSRKEMYGFGDKEAENKNDFYKEVEKDLEALDKELVSKRCEFGGSEEYCSTIESFVKEIQQKNLYNDTKALIDDFKSNVLDIFPKQASFAGLFLVDALKFKYIPKSELPTYIENYRLSVGKPKIRLKKV
jgi:hypothetical protein